MTTLLRRSLPCLAVYLILLLAVLLTMQYILQTQARTETGKLLAHSIELLDRTGIRGIQHHFTVPSAYGAGFLRVTGPDVQLILVTGNDTESVPDFNTLPPVLNKTWISLDDPGQHGSWTILSRKTADGLTVQLGLDTRKLFALYQMLRQRILWLGLLLSPLVLVPAWYWQNKQQQQVRQLCRIIDQTARNPQSPALTNDFSQNGPELVQAVRRLLERHERLATELRESMDNVAHDLRTPMTRLRTIAEYGLQEEDPDRLRDALADCLEESERVLSMLHTMLSVAEAEADTVQLNLQPVSLAKILQDVLELYEIIAEEQDVHIEYLQEADPVVEIDPPRMQQVFANLLDNAIKYGATRVTITLKQQGNLAIVSIADNGMGISSSEIERIWERLYRGDRSRSKQGLGLGLTLAQAMVIAHKGHIEVQSELNKGSTFIVSLPLPSHITHL
ncbi:two-component sensor histidine kinase [Desulfolithobacter dissulfuricans]|uniref:histidine kinase n=1 Tax=Desulfolithobacter dissulfuricans TaxID=2795293 RepID=A0A915U1J5_9BACT|nr:HAMP domain-containing sensor histidine kinase [Desulfolithobacter dissulfuricans]BCO09399.1 two-component sensor histidine kinase [Desulfolithobacter dissulfuricans]